MALAKYMGYANCTSKGNRLTDRGVGLGGGDGWEVSEEAGGFFGQSADML